METFSENYLMSKQLCNIQDSSILRGFIKGRVQGKLTSCEHEFAWLFLTCSLICLGAEPWCPPATNLNEPRAILFKIFSSIYLNKLLRMKTKCANINRKTQKLGNITWGIFLDIPHVRLLGQSRTWKNIWWFIIIFHSFSNTSLLFFNRHGILVMVLIWVSCTSLVGLCSLVPWLLRQPWLTSFKYYVLKFLPWRTVDLSLKKPCILSISIVRCLCINVFSLIMSLYELVCLFS